MAKLKDILSNHGALLGFVALALTLAVSKGLSAPYWWFALAAAAAGLWLVWADPRYQHLQQALAPRKIGKWTLDPRTFGRELLVIIVFAVLAIAIMPDQARGLRPIDHDHTVHFFKIWQFGEFLKEGRLFGWSNRWFAGYPAQYLYPFGADIYIWLVRSLSLGLMSLERAYAYGMLFFWFMRGYAMYWLGRRSVGAGAGFIAGLLFMGDSGAFRFGGWVFAMQWGVWPQSLSVVVALLALAQLPGVIHGERWRPVGLFGLFMGASLLVHPLQLLHFVILFAVCGLAILLVTTELRGRALVRLCLGYLLGGMVGALWLLPFFGYATHAISYGQMWETAFQLGQEAYTGRILNGTWAAITFLGLLGAAACLTTKRFMPFVFGLMVLVLVVTGSTTFLVEFRVPDLVKRASFVQFLRFATIMKPYIFLLAGFSAVAAFQAAKAHAEVRPRPQLRAAALFLCVALAAPVLQGFVDGIRTGQFVRKLTPERSRPYAQARANFKDWYQATYPDGQKDEFFRVGLAMQFIDHSLADLGVDVDAPFIKLGETPATLFKYKIGHLSQAALDATDVRYLLSPRALNGPDYKFIKDLGGLRLYEYTRWKPEPFTIIGSGSVETVTYSDASIVLKANPGASGKLVLHTSEFPRWHATRDGQPIEIRAHALPNVDMSGLIEVDLAPGEYRFEFTSGWRERAAILLFFLALIGIALLLRAPARVQPLLDRVDGRLRRLDGVWGNRIETAGIGLMTVGALSALVVANGAIGPKYDFTEELDHATVWRGTQDSPVACRWMPGLFVCGKDSYMRPEVRLQAFEGGWKRCIWAHPLKGQTLRFQFKDVPAGTLQGFIGIATSGKSSPHRPVNMRIATGSETHTLVTTNDGATSEFSFPLEQAETVDFLVDAPNVGARHFCFHAEVR